MPLSLAEVGLVGPLLRDLAEEEAALATFEESVTPLGNQETG